MNIFGVASPKGSLGMCETSQTDSQKQHMKWDLALLCQLKMITHHATEGNYWIILPGVILWSQLTQKNSDTWSQDIMEKETNSGFQTLK